MTSMASQLSLASCLAVLRRADKKKFFERGARTRVFMCLSVLVYKSAIKKPRVYLSAARLMKLATFRQFSSSPARDYSLLQPVVIFRLGLNLARHALDFISQQV